MFFEPKSNFFVIGYILEKKIILIFFKEVLRCYFFIETVFDKNKFCQLQKESRYSLLFENIFLWFRFFNYEKAK